METCSICFSCIDETSSCHLPCGHKFHGSCITQWLWSHKTCPNCRATPDEGDVNEEFSISRLIDASNYIFQKELKLTSHNDEILFQSEDIKKFKTSDFRIVSKNKPNSQQFQNLVFAFNICRFVKSNAIVLVSDDTTVGIGSGQPSRLDSCQIAIDKMNKFTKPATDIVAASDAFFPFVDGIEKLVQSGVKAVIQPAGSIRDKEVIQFANDTGTSLVFSKTRHFRH